MRPLRSTTRDGHQAVVVRGGHYVCGDPNPDAAQFVVDGPERPLVLAPTVRVTATSPVVEDSNGKQIPLSQLLSWLSTHQQLVTVFTYTLDTQGRIATFTEVYNA